MLLSECNPYIRYAAENKTFKSYDLSYSLDCRLFYFIDGNGSINIENKNYIIQKNTAILIPSGTMYQIFVTDFLTLYSINFDYLQLNNNKVNPIPVVSPKDFFSVLKLENNVFSDTTILNHSLFLYNSIFIRNDIEQIIEERINNKIGCDGFQSSIFKKIICKIVRSSIVEYQTDNSKIELVLSYIKENYKSNIDNKTLASIVNYHPYYMNKLMNMYTGMTLHQYLNHYRLSMAAYFLLSTDKEIEEISENIGFCHCSHFIKCFKQKYNLTPFQYRKHYKNTI